MSNMPTLSRNRYKSLIEAWQLEMLTLQQKALRLGLRVIINFEGWDAAGKGGAIRRTVEPLDPRGYRVYRIAAPERWEQEKHYLYRFWTKIPSPGDLVIFDRSWYGRVLVERVEGLASRTAWKRAFDEINNFEKMLADDGVVLIKFWFDIDKDEQLKRFKARAEDPFKKWKITDEDWRNREKWNDYERASKEMFKRTNTGASPWTIVPANNKLFARIYTLQTISDAIRKATRRQKLSCGRAPGKNLRVG